MRRKIVAFIPGILSVLLWILQQCAEVRHMITPENAHTALIVAFALGGICVLMLIWAFMPARILKWVKGIRLYVSFHGTNITSYKSQIASLQSQLSSANDQVASLQRIVNLSESSTKASVVTINQSRGQETLIVTFEADYAGYIVVSGTSTTTEGYLLVKDSFSGYPYNNTRHPFGTGATLTIPVLPGMVSVYFGNTNLLHGATATITVTYHY